MALRRLHHDRHRARDRALLVAAESEARVTTHHRERPAVGGVLDQCALRGGRKPRAWNVVQDYRIVTPGVAVELAVGERHNRRLEA